MKIAGRVFVIFIIILLIVNMVLLALGKVETWVFWLVLGSGYLFLKFGLPKLKEK